MKKAIIDFQSGVGDGWASALRVYGLRDCTIRNDGVNEQRFPVGRHEAYIDLDPGEEATLKTVELDRCPKSAGASVPLA
jgi:hypothetical protein